MEQKESQHLVEIFLFINLEHKLPSNPTIKENFSVELLPISKNLTKNTGKTKMLNLNTFASIFVLTF